MSKKIILSFALFILFLGFRFANAEVIISEVMYHPNDGDTDWVEIYNNSTTDDIPVKVGDATDAWRISSGETKYKLKGSDFIIKAGEYVVLACDRDTFLALSKHSGFQGNVIDITASNFSNTGTTLQLWDNANASASINTITYKSSDGADNDGNSLQLQSGNSSWKPNIPSPGSKNTDMVSGGSSDLEPGEEEEDTSDFSTGGGSSSSATSAKTIEKNPTIKAKILASKTAFAGLPVEISSSILGYSNEIILVGKYFWNLGDGNSRETINPEKFSHTYLYPGEYNISLEYYLSQYSQIYDGKANFTIKVAPLSVSISKVGDGKDFFIELTNNSIYEVDISRWMINANGKMFVFPKNSVILPKKQIIVSGKITGFVLSDQKNLKLQMPSGEVVYDYNSSSQNKIISSNIVKIKNETVAKQPVNNSLQNNDILKNDKDIENNKNENEIQFSNENLEASIVKSKTIFNSKNSFLFFAILLFGVGIGVYFIRRKRNVLKIDNAENFEILDE